MAYRVITTPEADADLRSAYRYLRGHSHRAASDWISRARSAVNTLASHPERCQLVPESVSLNQPIRELLFGTGNRGTYRILFAVMNKSVYVLSVRHGSMLPLGSEPQ
jgi:plasmid stabilization system protein ParE